MYQIEEQRMVGGSFQWFWVSSHSTRAHAEYAMEALNGAWSNHFRVVHLDMSTTISAVDSW